MADKKKYLLFQNNEESLNVVPQGTLKKAKVAGKEICLARTQHGLAAFYNQCPHMGYPLSQGTLNFSNEVICPWHTYRFDLQHGNESNARCRALELIEIVYEEGKIYLCL